MPASNLHQSLWTVGLLGKRKRRCLMLVDEPSISIVFSTPTLSALRRQVYLPRLGESDSYPTPRVLFRNG